MINISGQLQDQSGTAITSNAWVRFNMRYLGGNQPYVAGTALVSPAGSQDGPTWYKDFAVDGSGNISGTLYSTSEVTVGGLTGVIAYGMVIYRNGQPGPESIVSAAGDININNPNILSTQPVSVAPTGDTTYLRLDASNSPVTGSVTFSGSVTTKNLNGILNAADFSGADIGAQINAAYAALPATGGSIYVPAGTYAWSTPIVFATANKYVQLVGVPKATRLNYSPITGVGVTVNTGNAGLPIGHGISGIVFAGSGSGTSTTGMIFGGANGAVGARFQDVQWDAWGIATQIGSNTQGILFDHCVLSGSGQGFFYPTGLSNAGEQIDFRNCNISGPTGTFALNYFQVPSGIAGLALIHLTDCHVDAAQISLAGSHSTHISGLHMENTANVVIGSNSFIKLSAGAATIAGCNLISEQVNLPQYLIDVQGGTLTLQSPDFTNVTGTLTTAIHVAATGVLNVLGLRGLNGITNLYSVDVGGKVGKFDSGGLTLIGGNNSSGGSIIPNSGQTISGVTGTLFGWLQSGVAHLAEMDTSGNFGVLGALKSGNANAFGTTTIGGGTSLARYARYTPTLSPASVAANTTAEQTFTNVLTSGDFVVGVSKPTAQAGLGIVGWRASGTSLLITFANNTGSPIVPTGSEVYQVVAVQ